MERRRFLHVISALPAAAAVPLLAGEPAPQAPQGSAGTPAAPQAGAPIAPAAVLEAAALASGAAPGSVPDTIPAAVPAAVPVPRFFSAAQLGALRRLSELFMPPMHGRPGAAEAGAAEFLDFYLSVSAPDRQQLYLAGLDDLEAEARSRFGRGFADLAEAEADSIVKPMFRPRGSSNGYQALLDLGPFVNRAYQDIRTVTINSPAWGESARAAGLDVLTPLFWSPVDPTLPLCGGSGATAPAAGRRS